MSDVGFSFHVDLMAAALALGYLLGSIPFGLFFSYASGAGDVRGGAVIGRTELIRGMRTEWGLLGGVLDPHAAFLILRGLKTYFIRYQAQCANAMRIAEVLAAHPAVARVHYPGLPTHPQHALAQKQMYDAAIAELQKAIAFSGHSGAYDSNLGYAYARSGRRDDAIRIINDLDSCGACVIARSSHARASVVRPRAISTEP